LAEIQGKNEKLRNVRIQNEKKEVEENARKSDRTHGTKMVLEQYIKWLDLEDEHFDIGADGTSTDDTKSKVKQLFKTFRRNSGSNTLTGLSEKAEGILSKAVELWPMLQRPFAKDPIEDAIETEAGLRGKTMADLQLPV